MYCCCYTKLHSELAYFLFFTGHERPDLKYLNRYVRISVGAKWHDLGIELLESSYIEKLNVIEAEYPSDCDKCCSKMFMLWLNTKNTASWNELLEALRQPSIGLVILAKKIENMLVQPSPQG